MDFADGSQVLGTMVVRLKSPCGATLRGLAARLGPLAARSDGRRAPRVATDVAPLMLRPAPDEFVLYQVGGEVNTGPSWCMIEIKVDRDLFPDRRGGSRRRIGLT